MLKNLKIELKGTIQPEHLEQINDLPVIKKLAVGPAQSRRLMTVYYDTPDHELRRQGLSLGVRKVGRAFVQCVNVKQTHKRLGGIPVQLEWEVPSQDPAISVIKDKKLLRLIRRAGVERLQPIFRTDVKRRSQSLKFDDGSVALFNIDVGEILVDDVSEPIYEFELNLKDGSPERLFELASEILQIIPFRLGAMSKASRGFALLTHDVPRLRKYVKLNLNKDTTVEQVLTELVRHCLDHLQGNEAVILMADDAEGVHQMRIALRRLRAGLRLFKSFLPSDQYDWILAEAKWLTIELSAAREWDVFADEFLAPMVRLFSEVSSFDNLTVAVEQTRLQSRKQARDAIGTKRYTECLLRLNAWLSVQAWRDQSVMDRTIRLLDPIGDHCVKLLRKRDKTVRKLGQNIENLSDITLHELRLAVKKLRYAVDFLEGLYPKKRVKAYKKHLVGLQNRLGYLTDVAAADSLLSELGATGEDQSPPVWAYASGLIVGWHRHAAIAAKQRLVKDMATFLSTEPFWHDA